MAHTFKYKATDKKGAVFEGELEAEDKSAVITQLHHMGYIPIRVNPAKADQLSRIRLDLSTDILSVFKRVTSKDVLFFTQDLGVLLDAGLPLDRALTILIDVTEKDKFKAVLKEVLANVEGGNSLSEALGKHPKVFSTLYVNMIKAGETGGVLPSVMDRLGAFLENSQEMRDYIVSALVYPMFLVFVGGASIIIMLTYVLPKFSVIFSDMGQTIPASTQIILGFSGFLRSYWWLVIAGGIVLYFCFKRFKSTEAGRYRWDRFKINQPMLGSLIKMIEIARLTRTLGTLIRSGVPILRALNLVKETAGNIIIIMAMENTYNRVKEGETLSGSLEEENIFPPLALNMIKVGEETGQMESMLMKVADNYERIVRNTVKRLINLLEPALILTMGVVVGFIVVSMLMAVFSLNEVPF
ncbi:MAG: type II secretion system F family protein [Desulfobacterales bacterium]|nr:type II secretion system F family protein [Desulfobacterales bacterium]